MGQLKCYLHSKIIIFSSFHENTGNSYPAKNEIKQFKNKCYDYFEASVTTVILKTRRSEHRYYIKNRNSTSICSANKERAHHNILEICQLFSVRDWRKWLKLWGLSKRKELVVKNEV